MERELKNGKIREFIVRCC
jgi:hypothetical protein